MIKSLLLRSLQSFYLVLLSRNYTRDLVVPAQGSSEKKISALMSLRTIVLELKVFFPPTYISHLQSWALLMHQEVLQYGSAAEMHVIPCQDPEAALRGTQY